MSSEYDLRNMTKVELYRNHLGQLFVDTPPSQVGGENTFMRLEVVDARNNRWPVFLNEPTSGAKAEGPPEAPSSDSRPRSADGTDAKLTPRDGENN